MEPQDVVGSMPCYYSQAARAVIDLVGLGSELSCYSKLTEAQIRAQYPDVVKLPLEEAAARHEASWIDAEATECAEADFHEALGCLPPANNCRRADSHSFMLCEHITGRVTWIFVRLGSRFFRFRDLCSLTHEQIVAKARRRLLTTNGA